jgi:hypothetical protein
VGAGAVRGLPRGLRFRGNEIDLMLLHLFDFEERKILSTLSMKCLLDCG